MTACNCFVIVGRKKKLHYVRRWRSIICSTRGVFKLNVMHLKDQMNRLKLPPSWTKAENDMHEEVQLVTLLEEKFYLIEKYAVIVMSDSVEQRNLIASLHLYCWIHSKGWQVTDNQLQIWKLATNLPLITASQVWKASLNKQKNILELPLNIQAVRLRLNFKGQSLTKKIHPVPLYSVQKDPSSPCQFLWREQSSAIFQFHSHAQPSKVEHSLFYKFVNKSVFMLEIQELSELIVFCCDVGLIMFLNDM